MVNSPAHRHLLPLEPDPIDGTTRQTFLLAKDGRMERRRLEGDDDEEEEEEEEDQKSEEQELDEDEEENEIQQLIHRSQIRFMPGMENHTMDERVPKRCLPQSCSAHANLGMIGCSIRKRQHNNGVNNEKKRRFDQQRRLEEEESEEEEQDAEGTNRAANDDEEEEEEEAKEDSDEELFAAHSSLVPLRKSKSAFAALSSANISQSTTSFACPIVVKKQRDSDGETRGGDVSTAADDIAELIDLSRGDVLKFRIDDQQPKSGANWCAAAASSRSTSSSSIGSLNGNGQTLSCWSAPAAANDDSSAEDSDGEQHFTSSDSNGEEGSVNGFELKEGKRRSRTSKRSKTLLKLSRKESSWSAPSQLPDQMEEIRDGLNGCDENAGTFELKEKEHVLDGNMPVFHCEHSEKEEEEEEEKEEATSSSWNQEDKRRSVRSISEEKEDREERHDGEKGDNADEDEDEDDEQMLLLIPPTEPTNMKCLEMEHMEEEEQNEELMSTGDEEEEEEAEEEEQPNARGNIVFGKTGSNSSKHMRVFVSTNSQMLRHRRHHFPSSRSDSQLLWHRYPMPCAPPPPPAPFPLLVENDDKILEEEAYEGGGRMQRRHRRHKDDEEENAYGSPLAMAHSKTYGGFMWDEEGKEEAEEEQEGRQQTTAVQHQHKRQYHRDAVEQKLDEKTLPMNTEEETSETNNGREIMVDDDGFVGIVDGRNGEDEVVDDDVAEEDDNEEGGGEDDDDANSDTRRNWLQQQEGEAEQPDNKMPSRDGFGAGSDEIPLADECPTPNMSLMRGYLSLPFGPAPGLDTSLASSPCFSDEAEEQEDRVEILDVMQKRGWRAALMQRSAAARLCRRGSPPLAQTDMMSESEISDLEQQIANGRLVQSCPGTSSNIIQTRGVSLDEEEEEEETNNNSNKSVEGAGNAYAREEGEIDEEEEEYEEAKHDILWNDNECLSDDGQQHKNDQERDDGDADAISESSFARPPDHRALLIRQYRPQQIFESSSMPSIHNSNNYADEEDGSNYWCKNYWRGRGGGGTEAGGKDGGKHKEEGDDEGDDAGDDDARLATTAAKAMFWQRENPIGHDEWDDDERDGQQQQHGNCPPNMHKSLTVQSEFDEQRQRNGRRRRMLPLRPDQLLIGGGKPRRGWSTTNADDNAREEEEGLHPQYSLSPHASSPFADPFLSGHSPTSSDPEAISPRLTQSFSGTKRRLLPKTPSPEDPLDQIDIATTTKEYLLSVLHKQRGGGMAPMMMTTTENNAAIGTPKPEENLADYSPIVPTEVLPSPSVIQRPVLPMLPLAAEQQRHNNKAHHHSHRHNHHQQQNGHAIIDERQYQFSYGMDQSAVRHAQHGIAAIEGSYYEDMDGLNGNLGGIFARTGRNEAWDAAGDDLYTPDEEGERRRVSGYNLADKSSSGISSCCTTSSRSCGDQQVAETTTDFPQMLLLKRQEQRRLDGKGGKLVPPRPDDPLAPTHRVQFAFMPRHADELHLEKGDALHVVDTFDDHWCFGLNLRTGQRGIFPEPHIVEIDLIDEICRSVLPDVHHGTKNGSFGGGGQHEHDTFYLTMLASIEVAHHKGNDVLVQGINKVCAAYQRKEEIMVPQTVLMEVSFRGIHVIDKRKKDIFRCPTFDYFYSLQNISFCGAHPKELRYFGFITKHPLLPRFACHVFLSNESTQPIVEAIGRAFKRSYDEYMAFAHPTEDIFLE